MLGCWSGGSNNYGSNGNFQSKTTNALASLATLHLRSSQPIVHWAPYMHSTSPPSWNATPAADIIGGDGISVAVVAMTVAMAATAPATTTKTIVTSTDCSNHIRLTATQILLVWRKSKTMSLWINISVIF